MVGTSVLNRFLCQAAPALLLEVVQIGADGGDDVWKKHDVPFGERLHSYWKWPFIVDLTIKNGDFP